jgi:hypothetical protein
MIEVKNIDRFIEAVADYDENLLEKFMEMKTYHRVKKSTPFNSSCNGHGYGPMIAGSLQE